MAWNPVNGSAPTDDFNRADGNVGANWTHIRDLAWDATPPQIVTNAVYGKSGGTAHYQVIRWAGTGAFSNDQYAEGTIAGMAFNGSQYFAGVVVRCSADTDAAADFIGAYVEDDAANGSNHTVQVVEMVNGTSSTLATITGVAWTNTDKIGVEVIGSTIKVFKDRVQIGSNYTATLTTGKPGALLSGNGTALIGLDAIELGDATSANGATRAMHHLCQQRIS